MLDRQRILIVGGVAGGASCAARARRMSEWDSIHPDRQTILDVRDPDEFNADHLEDAINFPLGKLRQRMEELDPKSEIIAYCAVGQRSYYASRALRQYGFNAGNISGGYKSLVAYETAGMGPE